MVICAGLQGDRLAISAGDDLQPRILPFRGEYFELEESRWELVRALIRPVPKPYLPSLSVHFARHVDGSVSIGPNAVLALAREGYRRSQIDPATVAEFLRYEGFRKMGPALDGRLVSPRSPDWRAARSTCAGRNGTSQK